MECKCKQAERVDRQTVEIAGAEFKKLNNFKYLGAVAEESGDMDIIHRVSVTWGNWKKYSGVLWPITEQCPWS